MTPEQSSKPKQQKEKVLRLLLQGKALLDNNQLEDALRTMEEARRISPDHSAVRTLLALASFRAGHLKNAESLYKELIHENPQDATFQVSLATLYIKKEDDDEARKYLEKALSVQPDYTKAKSMLGLVYARLGQYQKAYEQFLAADQPHLANQIKEKLQRSEKADEVNFIQSRSSSKHTLEDPIHEEVDLEARIDSMDFADSDAELGQVKAFSSASNLSADENSPRSIVVLPPDQTKTSASQSSPSHPFEAEDYPFSMSQSNVAAATNTTPSSSHNTENTDNSMWIDLSGSLDDLSSPFVLFEDGRLLIRSSHKIHTRTQHFLSVLGDPKFTWEKKHFQGKPLEQIFGPKDNPISRVEGPCKILLHCPKEKHRMYLEITEAQGAYFREGIVLAFTSNLSWENGRVPSPISEIGDLPLDNFWGKGAMIIESKEKIKGIPVPLGQRLRVHYDHLIGWTGSLVPRITQDERLNIQGQNPKAFVEFEGEGHLLLRN